MAESKASPQLTEWLLAGHQLEDLDEDMFAFFVGSVKEAVQIARERAGRRAMASTETMALDSSDA